jgi:hypothetical protein
MVQHRHGSAAGGNALADAALELFSVRNCVKTSSQDSAAISTDVEPLQAVSTWRRPAKAGSSRRFSDRLHGHFGLSAACTTIVQCTLNLRNAAFWPFSAKGLSYLLGENRGVRP